MKKGGTTSTRPLVKKTKGLFYFKDVRRVGQLQAAKVCPERRKSPSDVTK